MNSKVNRRLLIKVHLLKTLCVTKVQSMKFNILVYKRIHLLHQK